MKKRIKKYQFFLIIFVVFIIFSLLPVADMFHNVPISLKTKFGGDGQIFNTNNCEDINSSSIECEAHYVLGADITFSTKETAEFNSQIKSEVNWEERVFYVRQEDYENIKYLYTDPDIEEKFSEAMLTPFYDTDTGLGISGRGMASTSISSQVSSYLYNDIEFSMNKRDDYPYEYSLPINGEITSIWLKEPPFETSVIEFIEKYEKLESNNKTTYEKKTGCRDENDMSVNCQLAKAIGPDLKYESSFWGIEPQKTWANINGQSTFVYLNDKMKDEYLRRTSIHIFSKEYFVSGKTGKATINIIPTHNSTSNSGYSQELQFHVLGEVKDFDYLAYDEFIDSNFVIDEGFIVKGSNVKYFLQNTLSKYGVKKEEMNEFVSAYTLEMEKNEYNLISFKNELLDEYFKLEITPTPDTISRIFMVYKALDKPINIPEQEIVPMERGNTSVIELAAMEATNAIVNEAIENNKSNMGNINTTHAVEGIVFYYTISKFKATPLGESRIIDSLTISDSTTMPSHSRYQYRAVVGDIGDIKEGFVVEKNKAEEFLETIATKLNLKDVETSYLLDIWLPILEENDYTLFSFQNEWYKKQIELSTELGVVNDMLRLFIVCKPLDGPINIPEQKINYVDGDELSPVEISGVILLEE